MTFYELFSKLKFITRFSGVNMIQPEKLESHILEMCGLAIDLYSEFKDFDIQKTIYLIILHDLDEAITVDIPRPFKYNSEEFITAFNKNVRDFVSKYLGDTEITKIMINAKSYGLEGKIVRLLDLIQVGRKLETERNLGNRTLTELENNIIGYINDLRRDKDLIKYITFIY